jgi:hypothetical protein
MIQVKCGGYGFLLGVLVTLSVVGGAQIHPLVALTAIWIFLGLCVWLGYKFSPDVQEDPQPMARELVQELAAKERTWF